MSLDELHEMRRPEIEKVVVHMGIGQGGRDLQNAEEILTEITGQDPVRTTAKSAIREFEIREGDPIGAKVTLRADEAREFLETVFNIGVVDLSAKQFDTRGNVSFGVEEHTEFPSQEYDPNTGIYGLDVTVNLVRPGYRVSKRDQQTRQLPSAHRLDPEDAAAFLESEFNVEVN